MKYDDVDRLYEELTLDRCLEPAKSPLFTNFGRRTEFWNWHDPYTIPGHLNPKGLKDIVYRNKDGKIHRIFGPAYISGLFGIEAWYKNGKLHREGGPAYIHNKNEVWFFEGKLHCMTGPAVINAAGPKEYWVHGKKYSPKDFKKTFINGILK